MLDYYQLVLGLDTVGGGTMKRHSTRTYAATYGTYGTSIDTVGGGTMKRQSTRTNVVSLHKMNQKVQAA